MASANHRHFVGKNEIAVVGLLRVFARILMEKQVIEVLVVL